MVSIHRSDSKVIAALDAPCGHDIVQSPQTKEKAAFDTSRTLIVDLGPKKPEFPPPPDFPDGGLRAWSIVFGVSTIFTTYFRSNGLFPQPQALLMSFAT